MFSCLQILEAFLWFVLITLLNVTLIILTLSVSRLLKDRKSGSAGMPRPISYAVFCLKTNSADGIVAHAYASCQGSERADHRYTSLYCNCGTIHHRRRSY